MAINAAVVYEPPDLTQVPAALEPLIRQCLQKHPGERPKLSEIMARLDAIIAQEHPKTALNPPQLPDHNPRGPGGQHDARTQTALYTGGNSTGPKAPAQARRMAIIAAVSVAVIAALIVTLVLSRSSGGHGTPGGDPSGSSSVSFSDSPSASASTSLSSSPSASSGTAGVFTPGALGGSTGLANKNKAFKDKTFNVLTVTHEPATATDTYDYLVVKIRVQYEPYTNGVTNSDPGHSCVQVKSNEGTANEGKITVWPTLIDYPATGGNDYNVTYKVPLGYLGAYRFWPACDGRLFASITLGEYTQG
jgi:hypothetical protein